MKKFSVFIVALVMILNLGVGSIGTIYAQSTSEGNSSIMMNISNSDNVPRINEENFMNHNNGLENLISDDSSSNNDGATMFDAPEGTVEDAQAEKFVRTYKFVVEDSNYPLSVQRLTKSDNVLYEPPTAVKNGYIFEGWFIGNEQLNFQGDETLSRRTPVDLNKLIEDEEVTVKAKFSEKKKHEITFFVKKELNKDDWSSIDERLLSTNESFSLKEVVVPVKVNESFVGWYKDKSFNVPVEGDVITPTDNDTDINLYGKIEKGAYLSFNVGKYSKTFIEPQFIKPGEITKAPTQTPERFEYTFQYWTLGPENQQNKPGYLEWGNFYEQDYILGQNGYNESNLPKFEFNGELKENKKLYAVWKENPEISYKINIFKQKESDSVDKLNDKHYEINDVKDASIANNPDKDKLVEEIKKRFFEEYKTKYTYRGFHIAANTENGNYESENGKHKFEGVFKFEKSDGFHPAELNVYYNRDIIEINFHDENDKPEKTFKGLYLQKLNQVLGQNENWPSSPYKKITGDQRRITFLDAFKIDALHGTARSYDENNRLYKQSIILRKSFDNGQRQIMQMLETLEDGVYKKDAAAETPNTVFTVTDKYTGFHPYQYQIDDENSPKLALALDESGKLIDKDPKNTISFNKFIKVFNKRNKYKITFENVNKNETKGQTYKYEEPLKNLTSLKPQRPSDVNDNYEFSGWYMDKDFEEKVNLDTFTMPSHDIVLYAKWTPKKVKVHIFKMIDAINSIEELELSFDYDTYFTNSMLPKVTKNGEIIEQGQVYNDKNGNYKTIDIPSDYDWGGWYYSVKDSKDLIEFDSHIKLTKDYDLYAYSFPRGAVKAFYYTDYNEWAKQIRNPLYVSHEHNENTKAVISGPSVDNLWKINKKFVAWSDGTRRYNKGDSLIISKDLHLYPIFSEDRPINLSVFKEWKNKYGEVIEAPVKSIKAALYVDGVKNRDVDLSDENNWSYTFKNLPEESISTGEKYNYEIKEVGEANGKIELSGINYNVKVTGDVKSGFTITNIKSVEIIPGIELEKPIKKTPSDPTPEIIPAIKLDKPIVRDKEQATVGKVNKGSNIKAGPNTGDSLIAKIYLIFGGVAALGVYILSRKKYNFK